MADDKVSSGGRVAALDVGDVWTGIALSDTTRRIARPLEVVGSEGLKARIGSLASEDGVTEVVVGVPKTLSGETGFQARRVLDRLCEFQDEFPALRFVQWDERFTTRMALREVGRGKGRVRSRKGKSGGRKSAGKSVSGRVDHLAAAQMLQEYLESRGES